MNEEERKKEREEKLNYYNAILERLDKLEGWKKNLAFEQILLQGILGVWDHEHDRDYFKERISETLARMES